MELIGYKELNEESYVKTYDLKGIARTFKEIPYSQRSVNNRLDIYLPLKGEKPYPSLVYIHGGGLMKGDKTRYCNVLFQAFRYGYAVICVNYRLCQEAPYPAMINDVSEAIRFIKANSETYSLDPEKLIVWGETHGAYLACLLGVYGGTGKIDDPQSSYPQISSRVAGVIDYWAFTDFYSSYQRNLKLKEKDPDYQVQEELIFQKTGEQLEEEIKKYPSPIEGITGKEPPFYILHSEIDPFIPREDSIRYYETLKAAGAEAYLEIVPNTQHSLANYLYGWQIEGTYRFINYIFREEKE